LFCLALPEQTAHSAQKPGEFGQWLGSVFMQGSLVTKLAFKEKPLEASTTTMPEGQDYERCGKA
jgi:hypothetical protein